MSTQELEQELDRMARLVRVLCYVLGVITRTAYLPVAEEGERGAYETANRVRLRSVHDAARSVVSVAAAIQADETERKVHVSACPDCPPRPGEPPCATGHQLNEIVTAGTTLRLAAMHVTADDLLTQFRELGYAPSPSFMPKEGSANV